MSKEKIRLKVLLQNERIGELQGIPSEKIIFSADEKFIALGPTRPTLSLSIQNPHDEFYSLSMLQKGFVSNQKLPPFFSNLLPEGPLRDWIGKQLKITIENELPLLASLGHDLAGAITIELLEGKLDANTMGEPTERSFPIIPKFSLAGVQLKFSMLKEGKRYTLHSGKIGDWIIKPPSAQHKNLPANEYSCMMLAKAVGVEIPEVKLEPLENLELPADYFSEKEPMAYAIKRFDRLENEKKMHVEDFAQVLNIKPQNKYERDAKVGANLPIILNRLHRFSPYPIRDQQQVIIRTLVNLLLGNGDAHLKNWGMIYRDGRLPELTPAYDIVFTEFYMPDDGTLAMKIGNERKIRSITQEHFMLLAELADMNSILMQRTLKDTLEQAQAKWPALLEQLPMDEEQKKALQQHWRSLAIKFI